MDYTETFSDRELEQIIDEGMVYMCACPALVADSLRKVRELYRYQLNCLSDGNNVARGAPDHRPGRALRYSCALNECLEKVLEIEQWDRATLTMPEGLRARQQSEMDDDIPAL